MTFSNSRNLLLRGWRGVLVEPHPVTFARLAANVAGTDAELFNCAASDQEGFAELFEDTVRDDSNLMATLSTAQNDWYSKTRSGQSHKVQLRRLDALLDLANFDHDFSMLSVDTEGHDAAVLASMGAFRPRVILTERALRVPGDSLRKQELLTGMGYVMCDRVACNEVYVHCDFLPELPHLLD